MPRNPAVIILLALGLIFISSLPAAAAEWDHRVNYSLKGITGEVPTELTQATAAPADTKGKAILCAGFGHTFGQRNTGDLKLEFEILRVDPATGDTEAQTVKKHGSIKDSRWVRCATIDALKKDDIIIAKWDIQDMPKGRGGEIQAVVSLSDSRLSHGDLVSKDSPSSGTEAKWQHRVNSMQEGITGKVPKAITQATALPADTAETVNVCAGFGHNFKKRNWGLLRVRFSMFRTDPETGDSKRQRQRIRGNVEDSRWIGCIEVDKFLKDDIIVAEWNILEMPKGRGGDIQVTTHIGDSKLKKGALIKRPAPPPPPPSGDGGSGGGGGGGDDGGSGDGGSGDTFDTSKLSAADQRAISAMSKLAGTSIGIRIGGSTTYLIAHRYSCTNLLKGPTIASTYDTFVKVCGNRASGGPLTKSQINAIVTFKKMKHVTALRWESGGTVYGEYSTTATGTRKKATNSIEAAVNWLVSEGRLVGDTGGGDSGGGDSGGGDSGGGSDPPPTDTGSVSAADQRAISAMSKMTAISIGNRVRGTARTFLIGHRYNCANMLEASTIAGVYSKFVKACGARATGGALTKSQIDAIAKLKRMKHTSAIRWESGGRVIGEYWSRATGTRHATTKSIEAAVNWLVKQGRL